MRKVLLMIINSIYISGFKNYKEPKKYDFSDFTEIEGKNARGKTSIGEAITWGLYGCDLLGDTKTDTKLMNYDSDTMFVVIDYEYEGITNRIVRKKGKSLTLKLNDERITEKDLSKHLPNKDLFLAVFNSKIFLNLPIPKKRELLFKMLPKIEPMDIMKKFHCNDINEILKKYPNTNDGLKELTTLIKNKKELLTEKNTKISVYQNLILENTTIESKQKFLSSDEEQLKELQCKLVNKNSNLELIPTDKIKTEIYKINSLIAIEKNKFYTSSNNDYIQDLKISLATLSGEYNTLQNNYTKVNSLDAVCQMCGQTVSKEHKQKELDSLTKQLNSLKSEIDSLTESIILINSLEETNKKSFNDNKINVLHELEENLKSLNSELAGIEESNKLIQEVSLNNNDNSAIEIQINNLKQKQLDYFNYKSQLNTQKKNEENYKFKIKSIEQEIIKITEDKTNLEIQYNKLKNYNSLYIQYVGELLSSWLDRVSINLFNIVNSTGEVKNTFELKYDGKPLERVSKSEYIKVGLELSNMFNNALDFKLPIFIDDAESILDIPALATQMIISRVKDCELTINSSYQNIIENDTVIEFNNNDSVIEEQLTFN
uniref:Nuclease SbcCD subunit C n=2 Tax=Clostridium botulinum TaxID=1491 RepID=A0A140C2X0_CLOBO|nr:putative DNA repair protein [Clostridium botulinum]ALT05792.1 putative DNA repair protein [Clostridium botulinum]ALT05902.1 putative DNA repair protein [Clostridium botulinum]